MCRGVKGTEGSKIGDEPKNKRIEQAESGRQSLAVKSAVGKESVCC